MFRISKKMIERGKVASTYLKAHAAIERAKTPQDEQRAREIAQEAVRQETEYKNKYGIK